MSYTNFEEAAEAVEEGDSITVFFSDYNGTPKKVTGEVIVIDTDLEVGIIEVKPSEEDTDTEDSSASRFKPVKTSKEEVYTVEEKRANSDLSSSEITKSEEGKSKSVGTLKKIELKE